MRAGTSRHRPGRWLLASSLGLAAVMAATPTLGAAAFSDPTVLARGGRVAFGTLAAQRDDVVVSWLADWTGAARLIVRTSTDGGATFGPREDLGAARSGGAVLCAGFVAAFRWPGGSTLKLDLRSLDGRMATTRTLAHGAPVSYGIAAACVADRRLAVIWRELHDGEWHLRLAITAMVEPLRTYRVDLGAVERFQLFDVAASGRSVWVAWERDAQLLVRRFTMRDDAAATVVAGPERRVAGIPGGWSSPRIAASDGRVFLGYAWRDRAVLQVSDDGGRTFGARQVLHVPPDGVEVGVVDLDALGDSVLVEIHDGAYQEPGSAWGMLSRDAGVSWEIASVHQDGYQAGVLVATGDQPVVAEAWDDRIGSRPTRIRFHRGVP